MDAQTNLAVLSEMASTLAEYALMDDPPGIPHDATFELCRDEIKGEHNNIANHIIWTQRRSVLKPYPQGVLARHERRTFGNRTRLRDPPDDTDEGWHGWTEDSPGIMMPWEQVFPMMGLLSATLRRAMNEDGGRREHFDE